ncbi:flavin reductase family protein [Caulobacter sp. 73W]|uniref:Flavin reductase family protein n=1 Tax=Caulobacter sp. 73W TaxID=3161137 RepID=A0AB39KU24_9CAUL
MSGTRVELDQDALANARALRDAFGCFTTGVTVVTALCPEGRKLGFTVNSFASVSLDPPLALICVDLNSFSLQGLEASGAFVVNVLHADQQALARQFVQRDDDRFAGVGLETWGTGAPIIDDCMANFECRISQAFDAGDHRVIVGEILRVRFDPAHEPLVYLQGRFRKVHVDDE